MGNTYFSSLTAEEMFLLNGGKLETTSDWLLLGSSVCACFVSPYIGIPLAISVAIWA